MKSGKFICKFCCKLNGYSGIHLLDHISFGGWMWPKSVRKMVGHIWTHVRKILTAWCCFMCATEMPLKSCRGRILDEPALCGAHTIQVIKSYPLYWFEKCSSHLFWYLCSKTVSWHVNNTSALKTLDHDSVFQCCNNHACVILQHNHSLITLTQNQHHSLS
jgi:hypothetical protein